MYTLIESCKLNNMIRSLLATHRPHRRPSNHRIDELLPGIGDQRSTGKRPDNARVMSNAYVAQQFHTKPSHEIYERVNAAYQAGARFPRSSRCGS